MIDREKVIRGLEACQVEEDGCTTLCEANGCPYNVSFTHCMTNLHKDALAILKAQVPRVMTLEGIEQRVGEFNPDPVFVEWRSGYMHWVLESIGTVACAVRSEGEFVRVWTSRPTEEQRKAVKWE